MARGTEKESRSPRGGRTAPRRKDPQRLAFLEDVELAPTGMSLTAYQGTVRRYRWVRRLLPWTPPLAVLAALCAVLTSMFYIAGYPEPDPDAGNVSVSEVGRTEAEEALDDWLDQEDGPFAGAEITSWDGVLDRRSVPATDDDIAYEAMTHRFTVRTQGGTSYRADVRIAYAPSKGAKVISEPSLSPLPPTATEDWDPQLPLGDWRAASAPQPVSDAVSSWSAAMTSSPQELKLVTRDGEADHVYPALQGVEVSTTSLTDTYSPADKQGNVDASTVVGTVVLEVRSAGSDEDAPTTRIAYDVLVRGADTAAPYVTAWGAPGTGFGLEDYENATSLSGTVDPPAPERPAQPSDGGGDTGSTSTQEPI